MDNDKQIDDIVSMIDQFMAGDGGHINVTVSNAGNLGNSSASDDSANESLNKTTKTTNSLECAAGDMACKIPTLHEGLDDKE